MASGKGIENKKDNPLHFAGDVKDWPSFKEAIQSRADSHDNLLISQRRQIPRDVTT
jgi:hypothetical protein